MRKKSHRVSQIENKVNNWALDPLRNPGAQDIFTVACEKKGVVLCLGCTHQARLS
jgi:hypothetical protein